MTNLTVEEILESSPLNSGGREIVPDFERKLVAWLCTFLEAKKRFILAVDGLRRVGKSTALKQTLNHLQTEGRTAFYFSFDKKIHQNPQALEEVIRYFIKKDDSAVICLDEVAKIEDWAGTLKKYYDRTNAAFLVSSSAAIHVKKGGESLAGRMLNYTLPPLGFDEYLGLRGIVKELPTFRFSKPEATSAFGGELENFLSRGSYPELHDIDDKNMVKNYIRNSTIEKMIFEDIPSVFQISHPAKLLEIFEYFSNYSGGFVHETNISSLVGLSEPTVSDYTSYLEASHLVQRVFTTSNFSKKIRKKKKGFVASASIYFNTTSDFSRGRLIETAVFEKLRSLSPLTYLDEQKHEVDFLLKGEKGNEYPIEVKSTDKVTLADLSGLRYYLKTSKTDAGYVIYAGPYDQLTNEGKTIHLIPLSTFLATSEISL